MRHADHLQRQRETFLEARIAEDSLAEIDHHFEFAELAEGALDFVAHRNHFGAQDLGCLPGAIDDFRFAASLEFVQMGLEIGVVVVSNRYAAQRSSALAMIPAI